MGKFVNPFTDTGFKILFGQELSKPLLERIPWAAKNSVFSRLGEIAEIANMTETQRRKYDKDLKILRDNYNILEFAKKEARREGRAEGKAEGRAEGIAEGKAEGMKEKAIEMAIEMLKDGMSIETVAKISKLSISEVEKLKENSKTI